MKKGHPHPDDMREGEVFLTNSGYDEYKYIGFFSKRKSTRGALDEYGDPVSDMVAVYVSKDERDENVRKYAEKTTR